MFAVKSKELLIQSESEGLKDIITDQASPQSVDLETAAVIICIDINNY